MYDGRLNISELCCAINEVHAPKDDFPILVNYINVQRDKHKRALMYFKRRPSTIIETLMETSHCLNPGSV